MPLRVDEMLLFELASYQYRHRDEFSTLFDCSTETMRQSKKAAQLFNLVSVEKIYEGMLNQRINIVSILILNLALQPKGMKKC